MVNITMKSIEPVTLHIIRFVDIKMGSLDLNESMQSNLLEDAFCAFK